MQHSGLSTSDFFLRDVADGDLPVFFEQQRDAEANYMAAFTTPDPADREAFAAHWERIRSDESVTIKTIVFAGEVAGHVSCYGQDGETEVTYWIGKEWWGRGFATRALAELLRLVTVRPLYARAAKDNIASLRVLEKCGFTIYGEGSGFSHARNAEVEEFVLRLGADDK